MQFIDTAYTRMTDDQLKELFTIRKRVFVERLRWDVNCINGLEYDEYDGNHTTYLIGTNNGKMICSLRLIKIEYPNMITGVFSECFGQLELPKGNFIESSRFFVDKNRAQDDNFSQFSISTMLFLAVLNYTKAHGYDGILTIVNKAMLRIIKSSGWQLTILAEGLFREKERLYLLQLPVDAANQNILIDFVNKNDEFSRDPLVRWPLCCKLSASVCKQRVSVEKIG